MQADTATLGTEPYLFYNQNDPNSNQYHPSASNEDTLYDYDEDFDVDGFDESQLGEMRFVCC